MGPPSGEMRACTSAHNSVTQMCTCGALRRQLVLLDSLMLSQGPGGSLALLVTVSADSACEDDVLNMIPLQITHHLHSGMAAGSAVWLVPN